MCLDQEAENQLVSGALLWGPRCSQMRLLFDRICKLQHPSKNGDEAKIDPVHGGERDTPRGKTAHGPGRPTGCLPALRLQIGDRGVAQRLNVACAGTKLCPTASSSHHNLTSYKLSMGYHVRADNTKPFICEHRRHQQHGLCLHLEHPCDWIHCRCIFGGREGFAGLYEQSSWVYRAIGRPRWLPVIVSAVRSH